LNAWRFCLGARRSKEVRKEGRILLFLKKKKQKDFFSNGGSRSRLRGCDREACAKVFFASFFFRKKKNPSLLLA
jgi:hypothetical protein